MSVLVPRLDRDAAREIIASHLGSSPEEAACALPDRSSVVTYSPVGGTRVSPEDLATLRHEVRSLAQKHGFPGQPVRLGAFEGACARLLHARLSMTPHEASYEEVWSYLTCCWLLDVALWRFGEEADERRFIGNVNRNTFRRLWWRAEILGPTIDLGALGEDELVNIMERPTIAGDRRLARAVAHEFLARVGGGGTGERMQLMREAMKRLLRLTPFVAFSALPDEDLKAVVTDTFDAAVAGLTGRTQAAAERSVGDVPSPSSIVTRVQPIPVDLGGDGIAAAATGRDGDIEAIGQVALDIARRTGRVTNMTLREVIPISSDEAREVFVLLMSRGALVRRGVKRGTNYVLPETSEAPSSPPPTARPYSPPSSPTTRPGAAGSRADTALRRLLRRAR